MAKYLVIVESPAKVKTIKKFLGKNYEVDASNGHVRDLPKSTLGFDAEHGFEPKYITIRGKGDVLAKLRKEVKENIKIKKQMQYKYEYLLYLFPELESYIDDLSTLNEYKNKFNDLHDDYDEVLEYISRAEYIKLSENNRNQLALDRYIKSTKKSKWDIGRDYELYCSYCFEKLGFDCEQIGIELKLKDLGRDIIAYKNNDIYIIQCKYWSKNKIIHEKHIAQLYGTTIQYKLENQKKLEESNINIIPYFVTNTTLSETAKKFAKYLNVEYQENFEIKNFPRIKCNNNYDEYGIPTKIYHLPMDQQYDRTKITVKNGDSYAYTVEEAISKGYRRARRHFF